MGLTLDIVASECEFAQLSTQTEDNMEGMVRATIDLLESVLVLTRDGTQRNAAKKKNLRNAIKSLSDALQ